MADHNEILTTFPAITLEKIAAVAGGAIGRNHFEIVSPATVLDRSTEELYEQNPGHIPYLDN
jgi:hypothetical protein